MKVKRCLGCFGLLLGFGAIAVVIAAYFLVVYPMWGMPFNASRHTATPITPPWALECWVWEDDANTAEATLELVNGYLEHDFPVRTVLIDSPWSLRYSDFKVDEERFPHPRQFFGELEERGIRVVLWMTNNVNSLSKDTAIQDTSAHYEAARAQGYLAHNGVQAPWWKGKGGFIDYTNPEARAWWFGLQEEILSMGIDGWKLDGTATLFGNWNLGFPFPYAQTHGGLMTTRQYMDHYYRDEYQHGRETHPEFITLARSIDSPLPNSHPEGYAPLDASTVNWVGDNKHTWDYESRGLERALTCVLRSAKLGYCVVGSDIGGYHGGGEIPANLYIRWAQWSAFCGLFLNGGHEERRMWLRSPEELEIIRTWSWLHTELIPYIYSHVVACHHGAPPLMRPVKGKYHYLFGNDFLVAPIYRDSNTHSITLPNGNWRYLFDDTQVIEGGRTITRTFPLEEYPVFVRDGATIPMHIARAYTGIGEADWDGYLTLNAYPAAERNSFTLHHTDKSGALEIVTEQADGETRISLSGKVKPHILRVLCPKKPEAVLFNDTPLLEDNNWRYDAERQRLLLRSDSTQPGSYQVR